MKKIALITLALFTLNTIYAQPIISNVTISKSSSVYNTLEVKFSMGVYTNPYNPSVIKSQIDFTSPTGKTFTVDAFYYSDYTKTNHPCNCPTGPTPACTKAIANPNCDPYNYSCETLTPNGTNSWKVRFTPNEVGTWFYRIKSTDNIGTTSYPTLSNPTLNFNCTPSTTSGFIMKANDKFLKRTTGEFFFPVGENYANYAQADCWWGVESFGTNEYIKEIDKMSMNKLNFMRVFLDVYDGIALIGPDFQNGQTYFDLYNQKDAYQLDLIFDYAKSKNINIQLCLFGFTSLGDASFSWSAWKDRNPFNATRGGPCNTPYDFFTNVTAITKTKNLSKYIVSRWGHNTNLVAWELFNEISQVPGFNPNITMPTNFFTTDVVNWHSTMYNYIKSIDPYKHLVTTSVAGDLGDNNTNWAPLFNTVDLTQSHDYKDFSVNNDNFQDHFNLIANRSQQLVNKPYMVGEWGLTPDENYWGKIGYGPFAPIGSPPIPYYDLSSVDPNGFELHNSLWSSCFSTSYGAVGNWDWFYPKQKNLYHLYKPVVIFMNSLAIPSSSFRSRLYSSTVLNTSMNGMRCYYMENTNRDTIYGWIQDIAFHYQNLKTNNSSYLLSTLNPVNKPSSSSNNNELIIPMYKNNYNFIVEWYSAETGLIYQTDNVICLEDVLKISVPLALRTSTFGDAVFKIRSDCSRNIWRQGPLSTSTYNNVDGDVVINKITGQVFYKTGNQINSLWWDNVSKSWLWSALDNAANWNVAGDLAISPAGDKVFYRTNNNKLNAIWWDNGQKKWLWSGLNNAANDVAGDLAVNPAGNNVFYRGNNNKLYGIWWNPAINNWDWTGLNYAANNVAGDLVVNPAGNTVFYKNNNNQINAIWWNPSINNWDWTGLNYQTNNVAGDLVVSQAGTAVFYKTTSNKINAIWWNPNLTPANWNWTGLSNAANNVAGDLVIDSQDKVFYRNTNKDINAIYFANNTWYNSNLDFVTYGSATAFGMANTGNLALNNNGDVFFRGYDNLIRRMYYKPQCDYTISSAFQRVKNPTTEIEILNTSASENQKTAYLTIYPNPVNTKFHVVSPVLIESYKLYDVAGVFVKEQNQVLESNLVIDVEGINNGMYFIKLELLNGKTEIQKVVINHL